MRARELVEYVILGEPGDGSQTYVYVMGVDDRKHAMMFPDRVTGFELQANQKFKHWLADLLKKQSFDSSYNSIPRALKPYANEVKEQFLKNSEVVIKFKNTGHTNPRGEIADYIINRIKQKSAEDIVKSLDIRITYGFKVDSPEKADLLTSEDNPLYVPLGAPYSYAVVDHENKTIERQDQSREYDTRMGGYGRGGATYLLPRGDFSMDPQEYRKLAKDLKKKFPEYTVQEQGSTENIHQKLQQLIRGRGPITAYHGTSNGIFNKIKKAGKMLPGLGPDYGDKIEGHSENMIYFTLNPDVARRYAVRAAKSSGYVILEVQIKDLNKLRFDEDSIGRAVSNIIRSNRKTDQAVKRLINAEEDDRPLRDIHSKIVFGGELSGPERTVASYIKMRALMSPGETSFAYEGSIPLGQVDVYEKNKTKRAKDSDNSPEDWDEVEKGVVKPD